jgi:hypothetical protein
MCNSYLSYFYVLFVSQPSTTQQPVKSGNTCMHVKVVCTKTVQNQYYQVLILKKKIYFRIEFSLCNIMKIRKVTSTNDFD